MRRHPLFCLVAPTLALYPSLAIYAKSGSGVHRAYSEVWLSDGSGQMTVRLETYLDSLENDLIQQSNKIASLEKRIEELEKFKTASQGLNPNLEIGTIEPKE